MLGPLLGFHVTLGAVLRCLGCFGPHSERKGQHWTQEFSDLGCQFWLYVSATVSADPPLVLRALPAPVITDGHRQVLAPPTTILRTL